MSTVIILLLTVVPLLWFGVLAGAAALPPRRRKLDPSRCARCGYSLEGLPDTVSCPECGSDHALMKALPDEPADPLYRLAIRISIAGYALSNLCVLGIVVLTPHVWNVWIPACLLFIAVINAIGNLVVFKGKPLAAAMIVRIPATIVSLFVAILVTLAFTDTTTANDPLILMMFIVAPAISAIASAVWMLIASLGLAIVQIVM